MMGGSRKHKERLRNSDNTYKEPIEFVLSMSVVSASIFPNMSLSVWFNLLSSIYIR